MKLFKILGGAVVGVAAIAAAPFTGGGSLLAGAAALGLGTTAAVVGAVSAGIAGGVLGGLWDDSGDGTSSRKLGIIGMKSSGKTTFLFNLGGLTRIKFNTNKDNYEDFEYKTNSGKTILIEKGLDIGGGKNYMVDYRDIISKNDIVFYFFNISEYLNNVTYSRDCNSRLSFIFSSLGDKKTVLIGTHSDKSNLSKNQLREQVIKQIQDKNYSKLFNENFFILNLTDDTQFKNLIDNLFS